ncbi:MAG: polyphosphate--glucose phosphotransferase [Cellulomonas sp.]
MKPTSSGIGALAGVLGQPESSPGAGAANRTGPVAGVSLGVDIGGTGIKFAAVDTATGWLLAPPRTAATPRPATPAAIAATIVDLAALSPAARSVGVGFPGVVRGGIAATAANLDPSWVGQDVAGLLANRLGGRPVTVLNDADAAGLAEVRFGSAAGIGGVVAVITLGTGIGTAVFTDGRLVPNTEYGHLLLNGVEAETLASGRARHGDAMTWDRWAAHLQDFLTELEQLIWPDLYVIGGGISAQFSRFCASLSTRTPVVAARLGNDAGIVGAAMAGATGLAEPAHDPITHGEGIPWQ